MKGFFGKGRGMAHFPRFLRCRSTLFGIKTKNLSLKARKLGRKWCIFLIALVQQKISKKWPDKVLAILFLDNPARLNKGVSFFTSAIKEMVDFYKMSRLSRDVVNSDNELCHNLREAPDQFYP